MAARIGTRPHTNGLREARLAVEHVCGHSTAAQIVVGEHVVPQSDEEKLLALVARREAGEPLARLLGKAAFWDFEVGLNDATLIPRDDTGTLVEAALALLPKDEPTKIVDVGTGSGIIALALARERAQLTAIGVDASLDAVTQATQNADDLGLADRLTFQTGNWLDGIDGPFDMIVSNPPYIRAGDMDGLAEEVRTHDPRLALVAGKDGLDAYRALLPQCAARLVAGGHTLMEIGFDQADGVREIAGAAGLTFEQVCQDMAGQTRVVVFSV